MSCGDLNECAVETLMNDLWIPKLMSCEGVPDGISEFTPRDHTGHCKPSGVKVTETSSGARQQCRLSWHLL